MLGRVPDVLPDCRTRRATGGIHAPGGGTLLPIYCANCGKKWGMVPEEHITFAFALCNPCSEKHGDIAHMYKEPDHVFWARLDEAQRERKAQIHATSGDGALTPAELTTALSDPSSALSKLAREWQARVRQTQR
jgi:hypothetical protein